MCIINANAQNPDMVNTERELPGFNRICMERSMNLFIFEGFEQKIIIESERDISDRITAGVKDNTLVLSANGDISNEAVINVFVTVTELSAITSMAKANVKIFSPACDDLCIVLPELTSEITLYAKMPDLFCKFFGRGKAGIKGIFDEVIMKVYGQTVITMDVTADMVSCEVSGKAKAVLSGSCPIFYASVTDNGSIDAYELLVRKSEVFAAKTGSVQVNVSDQLNITGENHPNIMYKGSAEVILVDVRKNVTIGKVEENTSVAEEK